MKNGWMKVAVLSLAILGAAFSVYGRLVRVETRLLSLENRVNAMYGKLFPSTIAKHE